MMAERANENKNESLFLSRLNFAFFIFFPIFCSYALPLIVYQWPLRFRVNGNQILLFETKDILLGIFACLVWFALAVGIVMFPGIKGKQIFKTRKWAPRTVLRMFLLFTFLGLLGFLTNFLILMPPTISTLFHLFSLMPTLAFLLGLSVVEENSEWIGTKLKGTLYFGLLVLDLIVVILPILLGFVGPTIFSTMAILYGMNVLRFRLRRKIVVSSILVGTIIIALPFKHFLREAFYGGMLQRVVFSDLFHGRKGFPDMKVNPDLNFAIEKEEFSLFEPNYCSLRLMPGDCRGITVYIINRIVNRINHMGELLYVMKIHPKEMPFIKFETYRPLLTKFIPRIFWKNKPIENTGQYFGHKYGFLKKDDLTTSIQMAIVVESWMSFGWIGIVGSALFMGIFLRYIWIAFIGVSQAPGNLILGAVVVMTSIVQETNLSFVVGDVIISTLFFYMIDRIARLNQQVAGITRFQGHF